MAGRWLGKTVWAIPEGYIPETSHGEGPAFESHETVCILNATDREAHIAITIFFSDEDPAGPYQLTVPAQRTRHVRFNELRSPRPIPKGKDYASLIESDVPVVIQHTRLDSRQAELALMSTMAFPVE